MSDNNEDWLDQLQGLRGEPARGKLDELPRDRSYERVIMRRLDDIEAQLEQLRWINNALTKWRSRPIMSTGLLGMRAG